MGVSSLSSCVNSRGLTCGGLLVTAALAVAASGLTSGCASYNYREPAVPVLQLDQSSPGQAPPRSIRIVTFNIEHSQRIDEAIAALTTHPDLREPDILLLQEMTAEGVQAIAQALSLSAAYYPASNRGGRDSGNAVLSRWPMTSSWKVLLPHLSRTKGEARAAVGARLLIGGRTLRAYSVHISSPFGLTPGQRRDQVDAVLADARASPDPVVLGGDYNGRRIGARFETAGYTWPTRDAGPSLATFSVDHVFMRGLPGFVARSGVARDVRDASDHRPVWVVLDTAVR